MTRHSDYVATLREADRCSRLRKQPPKTRARSRLIGQIREVNRVSKGGALLVLPLFPDGCFTAPFRLLGGGASSPSPFSGSAAWLPPPLGGAAFLRLLPFGCCCFPLLLLIKK